MLERDGRVLLAKRAIEPRLGYWDLPGGFLEEGEEPLDGLRREFREETGLEVEPVEWLGAFLDPYNSYFVLGLTWVVRADGEPSAADDVAELAWFGPDELPARWRSRARSACCAPGPTASPAEPASGYEGVTLIRDPNDRRRGERMDERGTFHLIEDDLAEGWVDEWVASGVEAIEEYLAKHLAFLAYLDEASPSDDDGPEGPSGGSARAAAGGSPLFAFAEAERALERALRHRADRDACGSPFSNRIIIGIEATP